MSERSAVSLCFILLSNHFLAPGKSHHKNFNVFLTWVNYAILYHPHNLQICNYHYLQFMNKLGFGVLFMINLTAAAEPDLKTVNVNGIDPDRGGVITMFVFGKEGFPKDHSKAIYVESVIPLSEQVSFQVNIDLDEYAIKILHDEDESGEVTKNWTGVIPSEGLGFSNDARRRVTGPPTFKRAKMSGNVADHRISIKYPRRKK